MKKITNFIVKLLIFLLLVFLVKSLAGLLFFNLGKISFEKKNYVEAKKYFVLAANFDSKNKNTKKYYVETLLSLPINYNVQKELFLITQSPDYKDLKKPAQDRLVNFKRQVFKYFPYSYITKITYDNKVVRWDETNFPLKIYFDTRQGQVKQSYYENIERAFKVWVKQSGNLISYQITNNKNEANIIINFDLAISENHRENSDGVVMKRPGQNQSFIYVAAQAAPNIRTSDLVDMTISFSQKNAFGNYFSNNEIYNLALHEIGHALGIMGHSYNPGDVMYISSNKSAYADDTLSLSDINTLKLLYMLVPDISNTPPEKITKNKKIYPAIIVGSEYELSQEQYKSTLAYIQRAPTLISGWLDLCNHYYLKKDYKKAVEILNNAYAYMNNDADKFKILYSIAAISMDSKDYNNAILHAQKAQEVMETDELKAIIAYSSYKQGTNKQEAMRTLQSLAESDSAEPPVVLLYAEALYAEKNYLTVHSLLKKLINNGSVSRNDAQLTKFGLIFLFL